MDGYGIAIWIFIVFFILLILSTVYFYYKLNHLRKLRPTSSSETCGYFKVEFIKEVGKEKLLGFSSKNSTSKGIVLNMDKVSFAIPKGRYIVGHNFLNEIQIQSEDTICVSRIGKKKTSLILETFHSCSIKISTNSRETKLSGYVLFLRI